MVPLKEILVARFGENFPVGLGSCKRDDPLIVTAKNDYVSVEYAVAEYLLQEMGFEYKFESQSLHHIDDRAIDELIFASKETDELEWSETRRFFFDVSAGFYKRRSISLPNKEDTSAEEEPEKMKRYALWAVPGDSDFRHLKSVEQKWEVGGFFLGPIWILRKKGPLLLAILMLVLAVVPFFVFGANIFTTIWGLLLWTVNAWCHSGLQAMRLKAIGHVRIGDVSAASHQDAEDKFRRAHGLLADN